MLSKKAIEEFKGIYEREFGTKLSLDEANEQASNLIRLYKSLLLDAEDHFVNEKTNTKNL